MATKRVIHNSKLLRAFKDFDPNKVIKKGSTSVICEHPLYDTMVVVYTTDKSKMEWFKEFKRKTKFRFIDAQPDGSVYDEESQMLYCFTIKKMEPLDEKRIEYVKEHALKPFYSIKGFLPNMKFFKMSMEAEDKRFKYMFKKLKEFVEHNRVEVELKIDSFMKLPNGDIICTDPIYATKER